MEKVVRIGCDYNRMCDNYKSKKCANCKHNWEIEDYIEMEDYLELNEE